MTAPEKLTLPGSVALLDYLAHETTGSARLVEVRHGLLGKQEIVVVSVRVERPQDRAFPIQRDEEVAIVFSDADRPPTLLSTRDDFPNTPHQNAVPPGYPASLCVDDRPWAEARRSWSAADLVYRVRTWLNRAVRGELVDLAQPVEPLFVRTGGVLVLQDSLAAAGDAVELFAYPRSSQPGQQLVLLTEPVPIGELTNAPTVIALAFGAVPQAVARLRQQPGNLQELVELLTPLGINLLDILQKRVVSWAGTDKHKLAKLSSFLAIILPFAILDPGSGLPIGTDKRAFCIPMPAGELGERLGWLAKGMKEAGGAGSYLQVVGAKTNLGEPKTIALDVLEVHAPFDRTLATSVAGRSTVDQRKIVMVGAGSIGSHVATHLTREGMLQWTIIDDDILLPHNIARHTLLPRHVGYPKASALAASLNHTLGSTEHATAVESRVPPSESNRAQAVSIAMSTADLILDASASVSVSRILSDATESKARRFSVFFTPNGSAVVLLGEDEARTVPMRDVEAQYYGAIVRQGELHNHLAPGPIGVRYSGSCRALTSRIPQSKVAILSGIASASLAEAINEPQPCIKVWTLDERYNVRASHIVPEPVTIRADLAGWSVYMDSGALARARTLRAQCLPAETGGVLLGVADRTDKSIRIVEALPAPQDSIGSAHGFERGIRDLEHTLARIGLTTLDQLRYVGEWHSHPQAHTALPSRADIAQAAWLREQLRAEQLPALMLIVADQTESIVIAS